MWFYKGKEFNPTQEELKSWVGFVYLITEKSTNKKYIGKKLFWSTKTLPPLKGKKRKRKIISESNWKDYFGSNVHLKALVENIGSDQFIREILRLCKSKGEMSYYEAKEQFDREVLFSNEYFNGIIQCRINAKHIK